MNKPVDLSVIAAAAANAGHGEPRWEFRFMESRQFRFDLAWLTQRVAFEREGGTWTRGSHVRPIRYQQDCEKYSLAAIEGWVVVRATVDMIRDGRAVDLLLQALERRTPPRRSRSSGPTARG